MELSVAWLTMKGMEKLREEVGQKIKDSKEIPEEYSKDIIADYLKFLSH